VTYNPNATWTARKAERQQAPVYYVAVEGLTTKHFSTGPVKAAGTTKKMLMMLPTELAQTLNPLQGKATLRISSLRLIDAGGEITDLVATEKASPTLPSLINRTVTLYEGDVDMNEVDYAPVAIGQISDVKLGEDALTYELTLVDVKRAQNEDLFTNADASGLQRYSDFLASPATLGDKAAAVANIPGVEEGMKLFLGPSTHGSYPGQEELVEVAAVVNAIIYFKSPLTKSYLTGDPIRWATTVIQGNPINIIRACLTGDFANGSFPLEEAVGMPTGLGVPAALIDDTYLANERDRMIPGQSIRFESRQPIRGFQFLEQRLYRFRGYPFMRGSGKFAFRLYRPVYPDDAVAGLPTLGEADVNSWQWERGFDLHLNRVEMGFDFDVESGKAAGTVLIEDTADQTLTKETATIELEDSGLRTSSRGIRVGEVLSAGLLRRYLKPPPLLHLLVGIHKKALEIGDVVAFTHTKVPNVTTGGRGYSGARLEIVERVERPEKGEIELKVLDPGFLRPAWIGAPGALPDYDSASTAQREYAHIAQAGTPVAGFSDGTPPYEVQ
jgi:hypothetical protein